MNDHDKAARLADHVRFVSNTYTAVLRTVEDLSKESDLLAAHASLLRLASAEALGDEVDQLRERVANHSASLDTLADTVRDLRATNKQAYDLFRHARPAPEVPRGRPQGAPAKPLRREFVCVRCGHIPDPGEVVYMSDDNGAVCPRCAMKDDGK